MDAIFILLISGGIIFLIAIFKLVSNVNKRKEQLNSILKSTKNFSSSFTVINSDGRYLISTDDNRRKILYIVDNSNKKHIFDYENLISVEILEDSNTTFSKSTLRAIGGGLIGGVIGGGVGAIVGGLSGSNNGKKKIKEVQVKILLRNYSKSAIYINCLESSGVNWDSDSSVYTNAIKEARRIADKLSVIIDLIDRETKTTKTSSIKHSDSPDTSIANEIERLYSLKKKGIISEEEYEKLKAKLL